MPEADQYKFANKELLEMLIKQADVHDGQWVLLVNFAFSAGNFGPSSDQLLPGAVTAIQHIGIQRAVANTPVEMMLDAKKVNPRRTARAKREKAEKPSSSN